MVLTTERLLLREFAEDDWPVVLAYQTNPRYLRYYPWTERTPEDVRSFVLQFISWQTEEPRTKFQLAITLPDENRLIGSCGVRKATADAQEAELGFELTPSVWGRGYATEAARAMATFGFHTLGLGRIGASCVAENTASARVLEKLGMRREKELPNNRWIKGRWHTTLLYAIYAQEWEQAER